MMRCDKLGRMAMFLATSMAFAVGCDKAWDEDDEPRAEDEGTGEGEEGTTEGPDMDDDGGEPKRCAGNETVEDCLAELGCAPVFGQPLLDDGVGGWCTDANGLYIGCVDTLYLCPHPDKIDCGDPCPFGEKIVCDDAGYWQTSGCVPDDFRLCEAPGELSGDC